MKKLSLLILLAVVALALVRCKKDDNNDDVFCPPTFTDPRDGQIYNTVQLGDQCWMKENLNFGTMINDNQDMADNSIVEKYCYNNDEANCDVYGGLYQWDEMMQYDTLAGVQGICPVGWHVPTDDEWFTLGIYVGSNPDYECDNQSTYLAKALAAKTNWNFSPFTCAVGNNLNDNNATNFTALPGGYRSNLGSFYDLNDYGYWWLSSKNNAENPSNITMLYNSAQIYKFSFNKSSGFAVRCIKDNKPD